ncbi:MAG: zinc ribbon domain-containing protein [Terriglobales bacterium]|jgi:putative FmdB family regulatory protein
MPLYEYQCKKCKHRFEKIQSFSAAPLKKCPECGGPLEKLISTSSVQFKGSGWYVTDYGKKGHGAPASSSSEGESSTKDASEASKASKKEEKPEQKSSEQKSSEQKSGEQKSREEKSKRDSSSKKHKKE